ncbi:MAG: GNAT family N-acetyltransferase [Rhodovulum sp.]|nr:GNAT family N-acetyltransferase [Rhodovulum sp.]
MGFMTLDDDGYIDLAFVAPAHQRRGIGGRLYARIETLAREAGIERLHSQASYLVRGLFERRGWTVIREQQIERAGVTLTNFAMEKRLGGPARRGNARSAILILEAARPDITTEDRTSARPRTAAVVAIRGERQLRGPGRHCI